MLELFCGPPPILISDPTTRHVGEGPFYSNGASVYLTQPTSYTPDLVARAHVLLRHIWRDGFRFKKAGIHLLDLVPEATPQGLLFEPPTPRYSAQMEAVDALNRRFGPGTVFFGSAAPSMKKRHERWQMRQDHQSPRYTTDWAELYRVRA